MQEEASKQAKIGNINKMIELPFHVLFLILIYCLGLIWSEVKQLWDVGLQEYVHDMWNVIDFITNSLYVATVALRVVSYFQVSKLFGNL